MHAFVYAKSCQNGKINEFDFIIHVMMYKKNENVRLLDATVFGMLYWYMYSVHEHMYMYMDRNV